MTLAMDGAGSDNIDNMEAAHQRGFLCCPAHSDIGSSLADNIRWVNRMFELELCCDGLFI